MSNEKDVGFVEDSAFVLQHMIALEHHADMSFIASKNDIFQKIADNVRKDRSTLMYSLLKDPKFQEYCMCKHDLAIAQGFKELAKRKLEIGDKKTADEYYECSGRYEAIFRFLHDLANGEIEVTNQGVFQRLFSKFNKKEEN